MTKSTALRTKGAWQIPSRIRPSIITWTSVVLCASLTHLPTISHAESYPEFNRAYWESQTKAAKAKTLRGAALTVIGAASIAPTAVLAVKSTNAPKRFLPYAVFSGIATLGMVFHGAFSISYGRYQQRKAKQFTARYDETPSTVNVADERQYFLESKRKTAHKMIRFGATLILQSTVMLANGIILSIQKQKGTEWGKIKAWPAYLLGGLLLPSGTFLVVQRVKYLGELNRLEIAPTSPENAMSIQPLLGWDPETGGVIGLSTRMSF